MLKDLKVAAVKLGFLRKVRDDDKHPRAINSEAFCMFSCWPKEKGFEYWENCSFSFSNCKAWLIDDWLIA